MRGARAGIVSLCIVLFAGCSSDDGGSGSTGEPGPDVTSPAPDSAQAALDSATPPVPDDSAVVGDSVAPGSDTLLPANDTIAPEADTVMPQTDTMAPSSDSVTPEPDTMAPEADTVEPEPDTVVPSDPCEACLASGGTWQPEEEECTTNCALQDISCYTDACPGECGGNECGLCLTQDKCEAAKCTWFAAAGGFWCAD